MSATSPAPRFDHLRRLTDHRGLFEHALGEEPRRKGGYCTDDAARALLLSSLSPDLPADLHQTYLKLVVSAVSADGSCHNRLSPRGQWADRPGTGDWWGRALWGLATALDAGRGSMDTESALHRLLRQRSPYARSMAYAALGAALIADRIGTGRSLLKDVTDLLTTPDRLASARRTGWPEESLTYDNAVLPHALLAAGRVMGRDDIIQSGLDQLGFLVRAQQHERHLSLVPVGGRRVGTTGSGFDQQPIEAAGLAMAAATAFTVSGDDRWRSVIGAAAGWFLGDNDAGIVMYDPDTGAGYDGLSSAGRNLNRGAESTIAANLTLLQAQRLGVSACPLPSASTPNRR